jgi:WD40 repeat protein
VAFSPDGRTIASASEDQTIILWDVRRRQRLGQPLNGHDGPVTSVAFSPDGRTIASASEDQTIRVWLVRDGQGLYSFIEHNDPVNSVAFAQDGVTLASGGDDRSTILWDLRLSTWQRLACELTRRSLSAAQWDQFIGSNQSNRSACRQ